jgi:transposase-like protein
VCEGGELSTGRELARLAAEAASAPTPGAALRKVRVLRHALEEFERAQVARALTDGASFAAVGRDLGLSRQAVHRRYRDLGPATEDSPALLPTPEVRLALRCARDEAAALGVPVGGEHVLLGLLRATRLPPLDQAGVTLHKARAQVEAMSPRSPFFRGAAQSDLRTLLSGPARVALAHGSPTIAPEHLLLGVLREPDSGAARTLRALGADPDAVCNELDALVEPWLS